MKVKLKFILLWTGIFFIHTKMMAASFENSLPQGDPGSQAKMGRAEAWSNATQSSFSHKTQVNKSCNQNIGNINTGGQSVSGSINNVIVIKGDVINICK